MRWSIGASMTKGAVRASHRRPAMKVCVLQCPNGTFESSLCPLRLRPRRRAILVVVPVSSRKTSRCGSSRMIGWGGRGPLLARLALCRADHARWPAEFYGIWNVESSVHGRNRSSRETHSQRIVENVNVKMQDVELLRHPTDLVEHDEMVRNRISYVGVKTKCLFTADLKSSRGDRVAAGEESHVVALPDEFLGEIGDDPLSSPVPLGWAA